MWKATPVLSFWLLGVAVTLGFQTVCSELARLAAAWGDSILLRINIAFYLPSVPLLVAGALLDQRFNDRFGRHHSNLLRATAGFGGSALLLAAFPFIQASQAQLLAAMLVLGVLSGAAASVSFALATRQGDGGAATVAVALGYVSSGPVVLAIEAGWRIGPTCPWHKLLLLYCCTAAITAAALAAAASIVRRQQEEELAGASGAEQPLLEGAPPEEAVRGVAAWLEEGPSASALQKAGPAAAELEGTSAASRPPTRAQTALLRSLWPVALALSVSVGTSMLLFPLFTRFRSAGALGDMMLPVVLFWVRAFADIGGRLLPKLVRGPPPSPRALLSLAVARLLLLPLPLWRIAGSLPAPLQSDGLLMGYVAVQWLGSGAVSAWSFLLVPRMVAPELAVQAAGVMTLVFNCACLGGLLLAVPLQWLL